MECLPPSSLRGLFCHNTINTRPLETEDAANPLYESERKTGLFGVLEALFASVKDKESYNRQLPKSAEAE